MTRRVVTAGGFDNLCSKQVRFLDEISKSVNVSLMLLSDELLESLTGAEPVFPLLERQYYLQSIRFVDHVHVITDLGQLENVLRRQLNEVRR